MNKNQQIPAEENQTKWIEVSLTADKEMLPQLSRLLFDRQIRTWVEEEKGNQLNIRFYFPYGEEIMAGIHGLKKHIDIYDIKMVIENLPEEDWSTSWRKFFSIERVGKNIVIKPPWENYSSQPGEIVLDIEPRIAFGSGYHPTTRLSLEMMEKYLEPGMRVLDMGCGSGILSFAGVMLGAEMILAVDNDPVAIEETLRNMEERKDKNPQLPQRIKTLVSQGFEKVNGKFDLVMVNILPEFLVEERRNIAECVKRGGIFITGSISETRKDEIEEVLTKQGLVKLDETTVEKWTGMAFMKEY